MWAPSSAWTSRVAATEVWRTWAEQADSTTKTTNSAVSLNEESGKTSPETVAAAMFNAVLYGVNANFTVLDRWQGRRMAWGEVLLPCVGPERGHRSPQYIMADAKAELPVVLLLGDKAHGQRLLEALSDETREGLSEAVDQIAAAEAVVLLWDVKEPEVWRGIKALFPSHDDAEDPRRKGAGQRITGQNK
eukprot:g2547.t1